MKYSITQNTPKRTMLVSCVFVLLVNIEARADPVFIQQPLDGGVSFTATINSQISTRLILSQDTKITNLRWWGGPPSGSPQPTTFSIRFFNDAGGGIPQINPVSVQAALNVTISPTALTAAPGQQIFEYEANLGSPTILLGFTNYYVSILGDTNWGWANSIIAPISSRVSWTRLSDGTNWTERVDPRAQLAFELSGEIDSDLDGIFNDDDYCPNTVVPESIPTRSLGINRFSLVDGDSEFDTMPSMGKGPRRSYTLNDTAGCACTQIINAQGLGNGHTRFGCTIGAMDDWTDLVN